MAQSHLGKQRNYYSGLEVDESRYSHGPEVYTEPTLPEAVPFQPFQQEKEWSASAAAPVPDVPVRRRHLKRWIAMGAIIAVVIIVAVVVGCVVGLRKGSSSKSSSTSTPSTTPSATLYKSVCSGTVCPQILAAGTVGSPPSLSVFARGTDNGIWYTTAEASSLLPSWPSDKMWKNMGGGPFRSQPAAASWQLSSALSVVAVADPTGDVRLRTFDDSEWNSTWEDVKGQPVSAVSLCAVNLDRLDMWAAQSGIIVHNYFRPTADDFYAPSSSSTWQGEPTASSDGMTTRPAIACRNDTFIHDLMVYDNGTVQHSKWSPATGWTSPYKPFNDAYHFKSDPVLLATTNDRLDFFGIGTNGGMYHFSWESATSYSTMDDLGGSFESLPSAVATDDGKRIDVVALGSNGTLLHRVLQDTTWSPAWEDLGVVGNSAPLLLNVSSTQPEKVVAFVLGTHDEINQTTWTASSDISWKDLAWSSMGGSMSSAYFGQ